jgi:large subunit ribosomal protein L2
MSVDDFSELTAFKPQKALTLPIKKQAGRNNTGRVTVRHRGGGAKRRFRIIDHKRSDKLNVPAIVKSIEYDPNRSAYIALLWYADGDKRYMLCPNGLKAGMRVICSEKAKIKTGNRMMVNNIPVGFDVHEVELNPGKGGQIIRSAGSSGRVSSLDTEMAQLTFASGAVRFVPKNCYATIGVVSNIDHNNTEYGKAGRIRLMGRRPQVLGKSMNACDHPHGGGEGHSPIGLKQPKTPWGLPALGVKTRNPKKYSRNLVIKGRRKNR